jgi:hypothetical protein
MNAVRQNDVPLDDGGPYREIDADTRHAAAIRLAFEPMVDAARGGAQPDGPTLTLAQQRRATGSRAPNLNPMLHRSNSVSSGQRGSLSFGARSLAALRMTRCREPGGRCG